MKLKTVFFPLFLLPVIVLAQPWVKDYEQYINSNFYEIQQQFNDYWEDRDHTYKGSGWKQFKRWEWFWEQRVYPTGEFPSPDHLYRELIKDSKTHGSPVKNNNQWVFLGPSVSNGGYSGLGRVNCIVTQANNDNIMYAGSASGGLWKSTNGGSTWQGLTDMLPSIGVTDIAIHPNNPQIIYIATGDGNNSNTYSIGVMKSTNSGTSWETTGLSFSTSNRTTLSRLLIHPTNPNILYAAGRNGVYKTTNGGNNWTNVRSGVFRDMEFKPGDPSTIYVAGTIIYRSEDDGDNWIQLNSGIPTSGIQRIGLAVTNAEPDYLYAVLVNNNAAFYGLYRSTNSGSTWSEQSDTPNILGGSINGNDSRGQGWYDLCIEVSPTDEDEVYVGGINNWKSTDGGVNWNILTMWYNTGQVPTVHADQHYMYWDSGNNLLIGNDGGVYKTQNGGTSWQWLGSGLLITQFYRIGLSPSSQGIILAGSQDNGTKMLSSGSWSDVSGGDGMECIVDPDNNSIMYASYQRGNLRKSTNGGSSFRMMNDANGDQNYDDINESGAWITPYVLHPANSSTIYAGFRNIWRSTDGGTTFERISDFNSSNSLTILEISQSDPDYIYTGTGSQLRRTVNGGQSWILISKPGGNTLTSLEISPVDPQILYATNSGYSNGDKVYKSTDGGGSWTNISYDLPNIPANHILLEDNSNERLYVGTDVGVYWKEDSSNDWDELGNGLPNVVVNELEIHYNSNKLRAATFGRGVWELQIDNPLQAPTLVSPANNSNPVQTNGLVLSWSSVQGAQNYQLQVADNQQFSDPALNQNSITSTSYTINNLEFNKLYYWRVKAKNPDKESGWSGVFSFTTELMPPILALPVDDSINVSVNGILSWEQVQGSNSYTVQISTDREFNNIYNEFWGVGGEQVSYTGLDNFSEFFWRVRADNTFGESKWSEVYSFTTHLQTPIQIIPENNSNGKDVELKFRWSIVEDAIDYDLIISPDSTFNSTMYNMTGITDREINLAGFDYNKRYFWMLRAARDEFLSMWTQIFKFNTKLSPVNLVIPANNSHTIDIDGSFVWESNDFADNYELQVSDKINFSNLLISDTLVNNVLDYSGFDYFKTLYWRVRAIRGENPGEWSETWTFTTKLPTPVLLSPPNNSVNMPVSGELRWEEVSEADSYLVELSTDSSFQTTTIFELNDNILEYNNLNLQTKYFWKVQSGLNNQLSNWSDSWSFYTTLFKPVLQNPVRNQRNVPIEGFLSWLPVKDAEYYMLQVADDKNFNKIMLQDFEVDDASYSYTGLEYDKVYYWRVRANRDDGLSDWSDSWHFSTEPGIPVLLSPADNAKLQPVNGLLSWTEVTFAESYRLQVSELPDFNSIVLDADVIQENSAEYTGLEYNRNYYWRVMANFSNGESEWSETWKFKTILSTPLLIQPEQNADFVEESILFSWEKVSGASDYRLSIANDFDFTELVYNESLLINEYLNYNNLNEGTYYWKVSAMNADGPSDWSETRQFTFSPVTSVLVKNNAYRIYPNPADKSLTVEFFEGYSFDTISVYSINGLLVNEYVNVADNQVYTIDVSNLPAGLYILRISYDSELLVLPVTIVR